MLKLPFDKQKEMRDKSNKNKNNYKNILLIF
jgi:hypothetical protein